MSGPGPSGGPDSPGARRSPGEAGTPGASGAADTPTRPRPTRTGTGTRTRTRPGRFALLGRPDFLRIWLAGGLSGTSRWLEMLAIGLYTFHETGSPFLVTAMLFARTLPSMLFGAPLGALAARFDRKRLLAMSFAVLTAGAAVLFALAHAGRLELWHVAVGVVLSGCAWAMDHPVRRTLLGEIAGNRRLAIAMSLDMATVHATRAIGPIAGGALLHWHGITGVYALAVLLNGASFLNATRLRHRGTRDAPSPAVRFTRTLSDGIAFARGSPVVLGVLTVTMIVNLFGFSYISIAPVIGEEVLGLDPVRVGFLMATEGLGAFLGSLALATFVRPAWYRPVYGAGAAGFLAMVFLFSLSTWFAASLPILLFAGLAVSGFAAMQGTLLMHGTPPEMRSRMMGLLALAIGAAPFGILVVGALSEWLGPARALTVTSLTGLTALFGAALAWRAQRQAARQP